MLIGKHYKEHGYNCANFVADWYKEKLNIEIPVVNEFDRSFLIWMRRNFDRVNKPEDHCLVLMINLDGSYHVGVYYDHGIYHNFQAKEGKHGSVVKWTSRTVKSYFRNKVYYAKWSQ